ncbi:conjugal transfer protein TraX [Enterococcus sp. BWM-S5]|uniref:Conjugal transfer protein TraX n=1 Tax=Enterococcus larvae TaxID=2794352 RepID=A0ABS4CJ90_9ENTE|nr:TraX family protein [Enterococcus larvae]MBP1046626.1 conjugal transfer protein TraX [Enterococcus larvae]
MNANQLKFFMMGLMVLDHISFFVSDTTSIIFHIITRCVGVFFAYMIVEGFFHTRNRKNYFLRLAGAAGIMLIGNSLLNLWIKNPAVQAHNNIFLTLTVGLLLLIIVDWIKTVPVIAFKLAGILAAVGVLAVGSMFTEGGTVLLPFILITYFTYQKVLLRDACYLIFSLLLLFTSFQWMGDWSNTLMMLGMNSDFAFISVIPFLHLYNGEKGKTSDFSKYAFYVFYPLHLWVIAIVSNLMVING